ncbi:MAG: hypothetical protein VB131_02465 [Burkholderia gladioli]
MKNSVQRAALVAALSASALLAACGGSPSESDVRAAIEKQSEKQLRLIGGKGSFVDEQIAEQKKAVESSKLIGCKSDGDKAFLCDLEINGGSARVRMLKGSDGWLAASAGN